MGKPSIAVFVHLGVETPTVFSTAFSRTEQAELQAWIAAHQPRDDLVRRALTLAEPTPTRDPSTLPEQKAAPENTSTPKDEDPAATGSLVVNSAEHSDGDATES